MKFIYLLLAFLFFVSCKGLFKKEKNNWEPPIFPSPPAQPRVQFLYSFSSSAEIVGKRSGFIEYVVGKEPENPIDKPYGITVHKNKIYISDSMLPGLEIVDLSNKTFRYFAPGGLGKFKKPLNCALDSLDRLYVVDAGRRQIVVFDKDLKYMGAVNSGKNYKPTDIALYKGRVWVCDLGQHRIEVRDQKTLKVIKTFPETDNNSEDYLYSPTNIALYGDEIYVTDTGDTRVKVYDLDGKYIRSIGSFGKRAGHFVRPKGIALDRDGNVFVVDAAFENVQIFNNTGKILMYFGGGLPAKGYMSLPATVDIDYENLDYFKKYLIDGFKLKYLIFVINQYGSGKVSVYGFVEPENKKQLGQHLNSLYLGRK